MTPKWIGAAEEIIRSANRQHAADAVMRDVLRKDTRLSPAEKRSVSVAVFAYFRWFGWLDAREPLHQQIKTAQELDARKTEIPDAELTARAVPSWVGRHMEISPAWARSLQIQPKVFIRARVGQGKKLAAELGDCSTERVPDALAYHGEEDLFRTEAFGAGEFEVQDLTSQIVGLLCAPKPGETWWDACAGEGGKTLHLSDLMQNRGLIWASDRAEWRLSKLKRRTARAKVYNYRAVPWDGGSKLPTKTKFDGVLVDAPCSGIGTWGRNPHARWTATETDVLELAEVQKSLLRHVAPSVKPGGKLIYSVCTLARPETSDVAAAFDLPDFKPLPLQNPLKGTSQDTLCLWPQETGGNGMFIAAWVRNS